MEVIASYTFVPEIVFKPENVSITNVTYESADSSVVQVKKDDQLYAATAGKNIVTASAMDGSGKNVKINVTVLKRLANMMMIGHIYGHVLPENDKQAADMLEAMFV